MKVIYCSNLNDIPDYPLMQMFEDEPGWESKAIKQVNLDLRTVYKYHNVMWVPFKAEYQPEAEDAKNN